MLPETTPQKTEHQQEPFRLLGSPLNQHTNCDAKYEHLGDMNADLAQLMLNDINTRSGGRPTQNGHRTHIDLADLQRVLDTSTGPPSMSDGTTNFSSTSHTYMSREVLRNNHGPIEMEGIQNRRLSSIETSSSSLSVQAQSGSSATYRGVETGQNPNHVVPDSKKKVTR